MEKHSNCYLLFVLFSVVKVTKHRHPPAAAAAATQLNYASCFNAFLNDY